MFDWTVHINNQEINNESKQEFKENLAKLAEGIYLLLQRSTNQNVNMCKMKKQIQENAW